MITDFNAKQDTFAFSPFDFDVGDPLDRHIVFGDAPTDDVGQFLYVVKGGVGLLRWDDDGTGPGGSVLIAKLEGGPVLDVANFTVDGW